MVSRAWCFTLNNPTAEDATSLTERCPFRKYICWGLERGESETLHFQGYMELSKPVRLTAIKKLGGAFSRMHLESRMGSRDQARDYCAKGEQSHEEWSRLARDGPSFGKNAQFTEHGDWSTSQGHRSDLDRARSLASEGGMRAVSERCSLQQIQVAEKFLTYHEEPRDWKPDVVWLWGPTGVGKSRLAREMTEHLDTFVKSDGSRWWQGLDGHEAVIIDDFRDSWWDITTTLSLLDRYEKRVETKGGYRQFAPKMIVITSCKPPSQCYKNTGEAVQQLLRRVSLTLEMTPSNELCNTKSESKCQNDESSCNEDRVTKSERVILNTPDIGGVTLSDLTDILDQFLN